MLLAFLWLSTRPGPFPRPLALDEAAGVVELWLDQPAAVVVHPSARHLSLLRGLLGSVGTAANLVNDAHLATLALEHGAEIVSFDRDFARFQRVRWHSPAPSARPARSDRPVPRAGPDCGRAGTPR